MEMTGQSFSRYFVAMLLLQMITPSSEKFTVNGIEGPILAPLGGKVELSCQLSPPQSAEHMEIRWFRNHYKKPVHLYKDGKDLYGETISNYVERTELLTDTIGEGKVTLRIFRVNADDDGMYHCFFKDGDFYEEAITEVKVTATSLETQILVHPPNTKGLLVECISGGWFPQPQMEWRDSRENIIPPSSKSHSQDTDKLFNMKMTLLLQSTHGNITCYLRNPVTGQEEKTNIVLSNKLFLWNTVLKLILGLILALLLTSTMVSRVALHRRLQRAQIRVARNSSQSPRRSRTCTEYCLPVTRHADCSCNAVPPWLVGILIVSTSFIMIVSLICYLHYKKRVPVSDPHFEMDVMWLEDMTVILCVLTVFITMIISSAYFRFRGFLQN
ncbi:putative selection and upkeep of intraepithelial T-cells protein 1 homolog isoform X1 [Cervus elaphus]|uniref:putative selection and upkeep of intraepithelial T-cells protein 1 homolog isoform X1 n=1 Tax=Cervus elaphus TaxID=9860 RepID=UPI001CC32417|nr:putative selection and upkeep of intraepithelial T-cells protein 1 homolog isoform X1 [Cervus elaphus]